MNRTGPGKLACLGVLFATALLAANAPKSYQAIEKTISRVKESWTAAGVDQKPNAVQWAGFFKDLTDQLEAYTSAGTDQERVRTLNRLYQIYVSLEGVAWSPAVELRHELGDWLRPRVKIAWAERRLVERVQGLPSTTEPPVLENREKWLTFVNETLGSALRQYDTASTIAQRQEALRTVARAIDALQRRNGTHPWPPSLELATAVHGLCKTPNLNLAVDLGTLTPILSRNLVETGPVYRKGYISQVTAGPRTGFGLLPSDDGIVFYNKQRLSSYTPIWDFEKQMQERDRRATRLLKLYHINAASTDQQEVTAVTRITTHGIEADPSYDHDVNMLIDACPKPGLQAAISRMVASLVGYDRQRIVTTIRDNAIGPMRENVVKEAMEMGRERTSEELARRNSEIARYLIGNDQLLFNNFLVEALRFRSRPEGALVGGRLKYQSADGQLGADAPRPYNWRRPEPGITADLHLSSIANNLSRGAIASDQVKQIDNLMLETRNVDKDKSADGPVKVTRNVDYVTFLKAVDRARAANDPKVQALRLKRPTEAPEIAVDDKGKLVVLVNDFRLEVPAPPAAARGGITGPPARAYRIDSPQVEVTLSLQIAAGEPGSMPVVTAKIENVDLGVRAKVYAMDEDEEKIQALTNFTSILFIGVFRSRIQGQEFQLSLDKLPISFPTQDFAIKSISPLDPSGWIRINLMRLSNGPLPGAN